MVRNLSERSNLHHKHIFYITLTEATFPPQERSPGRDDLDELDF